MIFPLTLTLDSFPDKQYSLASVVYHTGSTPTHGHFIAEVKHGDKW